MSHFGTLSGAASGAIIAANVSVAAWEVGMCWEHDTLGLRFSTFITGVAEDYFHTCDIQPARHPYGYSHNNTKTPPHIELQETFWQAFVTSIPG